MNFPLNQTATYWAPNTPDGYGGGTFPAPVTVTCRWEDTTEIVLDNKGVEAMARAKVFLETDLLSGGFLVLGTSTATDPRLVDGAWEIVRCKKIGSVQSQQFLRTVWLK